MILAALLLLLAQDPPIPPRDPVPEEEGEDIVVRATFGRTTMLFDKSADGTLRNCRIMVSSGSQKRDTEACKAIPVCYEKTRDQVTDCVELTALEQARLAPGAAPPAKDVAPQVFTMPQLAKPRPAVSPTTVGPVMADEESRDTERQRVKLPPLPEAPSDGPLIRLTNGQEP